MMQHTHNHTSQSGFSLVETLVAITILLIVITGPLTLISNSVRSTDFANDQIMAFFLAQEGLELVQAERDRLLIPEFSGSPDDTAWDAFVDDSGVVGDCLNGGCGISVRNGSGGPSTIVNCPSNNPQSCRLYRNTDSSQRDAYTHNSGAGSPTKYSRVIEMNHDNDQVEVVSTVTWRSEGQRAEQSVEAVTYLFNVYGR